MTAEQKSRTAKKMFSVIVEKWIEVGASDKASEFNFRR